MWLCFGYLKTHPNYVISSGFILFIYLILIGNIGVVSSLRKYTRKDVNKLRYLNVNVPVKNVPSHSKKNSFSCYF